MKKILHYINPIVHLGERRYTILFPLITNLIVCVLSEVYSYGIAKDPMAVGVYIIFINAALIIYFAFREGVLGGFIATAISIAYYFYIIYTRHYAKTQFITGVDTTVIIALLYLFIAFTIGWLKQEIDKLIEIQADERKHLETIIQQLPIGAIITDSTGKITHINKQVNKMLGFKIPLGFQIGKDTLSKVKVNGQAIIPTQAPSFLALQSGKPVTGQELNYEMKGGKSVYLRISSAPIHNKKKKIIAVATTIYDMTQQKEIEQQKDDFLSMASHELKTPMTSLKMFIDLQRRKLEEKDYKKAAYFNERIHDQANRLKELTNDLLDVSRIQTGKLHFSMEEFDLSEIVHDTVEGLQGTTKRHKLIVKDSAVQPVKGDRYRIYQVLVNLLSNAIKYSPEGKKIIIRVKKVKNDGLVSVQDFGVGIEKAQQKKIFERLYQVSNQNEKTYPGLGLGLFISKEIIDRHKGKLWVESTKGKGSTFYFTLPLTTKNR